jgi:hypothetical protein
MDERMNQMDNKEECKHNNTSWSALHDCHFCNDCQRWVDYDYKLKQYRVYIDGKWVLDSERVLANER